MYFDISFLVLFFSLPCIFLTTPPTALYPLSLHDALPISACHVVARSSSRTSRNLSRGPEFAHRRRVGLAAAGDRKSTRLNSSHVAISYAVFCLKKKRNFIYCIFFLLILYSYYILLKSVFC